MARERNQALIATVPYGSYIRLMIADVRKLLNAQPFVPFTLHLADGSAMHVPTLDHAYIFPQGTRVIVTHDDDSYEVISPLLISHISVGRNTRADKSNS